MAQGQQVPDEFKRLLDFSQPFDVDAFDKLVSSLLEGNMAAQPLLVQFQGHPQAWTRVDAILQRGQNPHAKMIALNILKDTIQYRWRTLSEQHRTGVRGFVVAMIIQLSSTADSAKANRQLLAKLNLVLVQIVKHEWPNNWPNFIPDLVNSSRRAESLCANNMSILLLLSEEVFDFSENEMTSQKIAEMKQSLNKEFTLIYQLADYVLGHSGDTNLLSTTLQCLQRYLRWVPVGFIFETNLIETLTTKFFTVPAFQVDTLVCLAEIGSLRLEEPTYNRQFAQLFMHVVSYTHQKLLPEHVSLPSIWSRGDHAVCTFVRHLSIFLCGFLKAHLSLLENGPDEAKQALQVGLLFLVRISEIPDDVIFKICLDYWNVFVADLYQSDKRRGKELQGTVQPLMLGQMTQQPMFRSQMFAALLSRLRTVIISKMAKPEEIILVEDDAGNIVRETLRDTDSITLYKSMRECLVYLTHLDTEDTQRLMLMKLATLFEPDHWKWESINTLCWAIGSISGALNEQNEKQFLVSIIKDLLGLCDAKSGKDNKAVVASNIMYVVGQYPRFMRMHWKFLKTVVIKLFEFMHETHPGVQEMSCDTFLKIAKKCRKKFVTQQPQEPMPYVDVIIQELQQTVSDLEEQQIVVFYEAVATIIQAETDPRRRQQLIMGLMRMPNQSWTKIVEEANQKIETLWHPGAAKSVAWIIGINIRVCASLTGGGFQMQLSRMYMEMLHVYKLYSGFISNEIAQKGVVATKYAQVRQMRSVKTGILKLIAAYVDVCAGDEHGVFLKDFLPQLMEPVLDDYKRCPPDGREPVVLSLFASIVKKFGQAVMPHMGNIFGSLFPCTLEMITKNFDDYMDHRTNFFTLLRAINAHTFQVLLMMNDAQFKLIMDSIVWAFKHIERNIAETGLNTLLDLLRNIQTSNMANKFYKLYFMSLLKGLMGVLTDTFHKNGFPHHATILARLFNIVETGSINVPLWQQGEDYPNNQVYVRQQTCQLLAQAFPHVSKQQIVQFVQGLFVHNSDLKAFKTHLRDFLVQLKEFADSKELYIEEQQRAQAEREAAERQRLAAVPGLAYNGPSGNVHAGAGPTPHQPPPPQQQQQQWQQ